MTDRPAARRVFYIHGFDPRGPALYHGLQVAAAAAHEGFAISGRRNAGADAARWTIEAGPERHIEFEFLRWDDSVRALWAGRSGLSLILASWRVLWVFWRAGVLNVLRRPASGMYLALLLQAGAGAAFALACLLLAFVPALVLPLWAAPLPPLLAVFAAPRAWAALDRRVNLGWFTRSMIYIIDTASGRLPQPDARCAAFADRILALREGEILVVGHSLGAQLAVRTLVRVLERAPQAAPRITFVTLGQLLPMYTLLHRDAAFAEGLARVAQGVRWIDITSASDPASTGRLSPLAGLGRPDLEARLRRIPPAFHKTLPAERLRHIRIRPLEFHFQYLKAADHTRGFDFLHFICGTLP